MESYIEPIEIIWRERRSYPLQVDAHAALAERDKALKALADKWEGFYNREGYDRRSFLVCARDLRALLAQKGKS